MEALASSLLVFIPTTSAFLVYKYAQKEVSCHIKTMTALSWLFCFSAYALLPIDIYYTTHHPFSSDRPTIETAWTLIYWGNFAFSWVILPFFMAYETCGEFDILSKTKRALLENLIYYVYFALGMLPLLIFTYSLGLLDK
jgi:hypothetical protein